MENKQFVFFPNKAKSLSNYFSTNDNKIYGVVTSSISKSTFEKIADISWSIDRDRVRKSVITFNSYNLKYVNTDAKNTGGVNLLCTTSNC